MAAWLPRFSGPTQEEIQSLTDFVKSKRKGNSDFCSVQSLSGSIEKGELLYKDNCTMCHSTDGRGAQVISISNPDLLAVATDEYLYKTIVNGRGNTVMPGWGQP